MGGRQLLFVGSICERRAPAESDGSRVGRHLTSVSDLVQLLAGRLLKSFTILRLSVLHHVASLLSKLLLVHCGP